MVVACVYDVKARAKDTLTACRPQLTVRRKLCASRVTNCRELLFETYCWRIDPRFAKLIRGSGVAKVVVMSEYSTEQIRELLDSLYRVDSGRILATLIRLLGDFDLAEEAMHEAFAA